MYRGPRSFVAGAVSRNRTPSAYQTRHQRRTSNDGISGCGIRLHREDRRKSVCHLPGIPRVDGTLISETGFWHNRSRPLRGGRKNPRRVPEFERFLTRLGTGFSLVVGYRLQGVTVHWFESSRATRSFKYETTWLRQLPFSSFVAL
jgi:hypothetical protein